MNDTVNAILWSISLIMSFFSIIFSILAFFFSNKSTNLIRKNLEKTLISSEGNKYFFKNIKDLKVKNINAVHYLKNNINEITFKSYNFNSQNTRMEIISMEIIDSLLNSQFHEIITFYEAERKLFNETFKNIVPMEKISNNSEEKVSNEITKKLINYHEEIIKFSNKIMKKYSNLILRDN